MKNTLLLFLALISAYPSMAQEGTFEELNKGKNKGWFQHYELILRGGAVLAHNEKMQELTENPFQAWELRFGWQTYGEREYNQKLNFPTYGIGFYFAYFNNGDIGNPNATFGFIDFPAFRGKNNSRFNTTLGVGLSYQFNNYDAIDNPNNIAIGSRVNLYFNLGFNYQWNINERWSVKPGVNMSHFSNSSTIQPNLGLNMIDVSVGTQYRFNPGKKKLPKEDHDDIHVNPEFIRSAQTPVWKRNRIYFRVAGGIRQNGNKENNYYGRAYYGTALATANYSYQLGHSYRLGASFDYMYDGSTATKYWTWEGKEAPDYANSTIGISVVNTMLIGRLELDLGIGYYIWKQYDYPLGIYVRPGAKFRLTEDFFVMVSFKTEYIGQAQYIEWGIGMDVF